MRPTPGTTVAVEIDLDPFPRGLIRGRVVASEVGDPVRARISLARTPLTPVTSDPTSGSFHLEAPVGTYHLMVESFGYEAWSTGPLTLTTGGLDLDVSLAPVTRPQILLVADDEDKGYVEFCRRVLIRLRQKFTTWSTHQAGSPTFRQLARYPLLIWFTGDAARGTLTEADQETLARYLREGGRLFLTGQGIAKDLESAPGFLHEWFQVTVATNPSGNKKQVVLGTREFDFTGSGGAGNQKTFSRMEVRSGGWSEPLLTYKGSDHIAGVVIHRRRYAGIYLGFGLEGVGPDSDRRELLQLLMERLMLDEALDESILRLHHLAHDGDVEPDEVETEARGLIGGGVAPAPAPAGARFRPTSRLQHRLQGYRRLWEALVPDRPRGHTPGDLEP